MSVKRSRVSLGWVAVVGVLLVSGCSAPGTAAPSAAPSSEASAAATPSTGSGTLARIKSEGIITIGMTNDVPFFFMEGNSTELKGIDADMMKYIADRMGVKINVYVTDFNSLIPALQAKKFDIVADAMWITEKRKQILNFTDPWYMAGDGLIIRKGDTRIKSPSDLTNLVVGMQTGSVMIEWVQTLPGVQIKLYDTQAMALLDLTNGRTDAVVTDAALAAYMIENDPTLKLELVTPYTAHFPGVIGAATRMEDTDLLQELNGHLKAMKAEGKDLEILRKWGLNEDNLQQ